MTDAPDDRGAYARRLIAAGAPELTEADLALISDRPDPDASMIPAGVADKIMDVLLAFEDRLERIERAGRAEV